MSTGTLPEPQSLLGLICCLAAGTREAKHKVFIIFKGDFALTELLRLLEKYTTHATEFKDGGCTVSGKKCILGALSHSQV
jgi:hypothetical protein